MNNDTILQLIRSVHSEHSQLLDILLDMPDAYVTDDVGHNLDNIHDMLDNVDKDFRRHEILPDSRNTADCLNSISIAKIAIGDAYNEIADYYNGN